MSPQQTTSALGSSDSLGTYRLVEELGHGGMGTVYNSPRNLKRAPCSGARSLSGAGNVVIALGPRPAAHSAAQNLSSLAHQPRSSLTQPLPVAYRLSSSSYLSCSINFIGCARPAPKMLEKSAVL